METELTDSDKQQLISLLYLNKVYAPGLDRLALRVAESVSDKHRNSAMLTLSYYLAACGNSELADEVARHRLAGYARASAFSAIGTELARTNAAKAQGYLTDAEKALQDVGDFDEKTILIERIVQGYLELGNYGKAEDLARAVARNDERIFTLCSVAEKLASVGETKRAGDIVEEIRQNVATVVKEEEKAGALADMARVSVKLGRLAEAVETWMQAAKLAKHAPDAPKLLLSICQSLADIGERERAKNVAMAIQNEARKAQALSLIGA